MGCRPGWLERLSEQGVPAVWIRSLRVLLDVVDDPKQQLAAIDKELRPIARTEHLVQLLSTIPGIGELPALTIAAELGEIGRFLSARKLIGYADWHPRSSNRGRARGPAGSPKRDHLALVAWFNGAALVIFGELSSAVWLG